MKFAGICGIKKLLAEGLNIHFIEY